VPDARRQKGAVVSRPQFISEAGASLVTKSVLAGETDIRWLERKPSQDPVDNGWRVFGDADSSDYLSAGENWQIVDFNRLCAMEPALLAIWPLPVGTRLTLVTTSKGERIFIDDVTGQQINADDIHGGRREGSATD
jgi:hypothetical protein